MSMRNTQRYGGREAVGSALWLEHCRGLIIPGDSDTEDGATQLITPKNLREDEVDFSSNGYIKTWKLDETAVVGLNTSQILRNYVLPTLPVRITGDTQFPELVLNTELATHTAPAELTDPAGTTVFASNRPDTVPTFSVRFVPMEGEIESLGIYPGSSDDRYVVNAIEIDDVSLRAVIGGRILVECFKVPQDEDLPPQIAPSEF